MTENSLPSKPYYRVSDLAQRWKISEEDVMEYVRCDMLTVSTYIKDEFADVSQLIPCTDIYTDPCLVELDGIYQIDGTSAIRAFYEKDNFSIYVKEIKTEWNKVIFSKQIAIQRDHLLISNKDLEKFEKKYNIKQDEKISDQIFLSGREKESFLLTIGALAESIANDHGNKFKKNNRPNISQITEHVLEFIGEDNVYGIGKSSLNERISKGLKCLDKKRKNS
jgi:hypothetical protein